MPKTLYIIDGHAQIYRSFYAPFRELTSPSGEPTRATYVFFQSLLSLIQKRKPDYLAVTLDVSDKTVFRCDIDPEYKANRDPAPEALHVQADRIVSIIEGLGIPIHRIEGFEADDLMATIVEERADDDLAIYMVSGDKDLEQLLGERVYLYSIGKDAELGGADLFDKKGYTPEQAVEIQCLTGDSTDNIPGVHGIGLKTAAKLIARYGSAEAVIAHADDLTPKMSERVKAYVDQLPITRQLVTLRRDAPVAFDLDACRLDRIDFSAALPIFGELGFGRLTEAYASMAGVDVKGGDPAALGAVGSDDHPRAEPGQYEAVDTEEKLERLADSLGRQKCFAFDTETTGLNPVSSALVGISISFESGKACYIPVRGMMGNLLPVATVVEALKPIFENPDIAKVGHHLKYDVVVLRQVGIAVAGMGFDTMIASALLDPMRRSHSLDYLAQALIGHDMIPISDLIGKGKDQITLDQVEVSRVVEYAAEDADFTWRLKETLEPQIESSPFAPLFRDTEMPLVEVLGEMEHNGIALDTDLLKRLSVSMEDRLVELSREIQEQAGHSFNVDSTKQLAVVLFDEQGLEVVKKTKTGRSTDAATLETLVQRTDHPIPTLVLEYRGLAKLKNTYLDTLPKMVCPRTGRVHASFHQTGAVTGRLSSSDPNLQNIPIRTETGRRIREAFIAGDPKSVLLTADYSQVELRLLAHFCKDEALVEAFRSDRDIHATVAARINGVALEEVTAEQRSAAKAVNFGIIYGQSAFGLARSLGIPVGDAKAFIEAYFAQYPGIRRFIDTCIERAKSTGYAETILGRRRPIEELSSRNAQQRSFGERIAVNTVVQGSAADLIKRAMVDIHRELKAGDHQTKMIIQVHDELVFQVPEKDVEQEAEMIRDKMEHALKLDVPITVDIAWGSNWARGNKSSLKKP